MGTSKKQETNRRTYRFLVDLMRPVGNECIIKNTYTYEFYFYFVNSLYNKVQQKRKINEVIEVIMDVAHLGILLLTIFSKSLFPWSLIFYGIIIIPYGLFCYKRHLKVKNKEDISIFNIQNWTKATTRIESRAILICKEIHYIYKNSDSTEKKRRLEFIAYAIIAESLLSGKTLYNTEIKVDFTTLFQFDINKIIEIYDRELNVPMSKCVEIPQFLSKQYKCKII